MGAGAGLFERAGDISALAVLRMVLGPVVVVHLWPFLADARAGVFYDDHFWHPYVVVGAAAARRAVGARCCGSAWSAPC